MFEVEIYARVSCKFAYVIVNERGRAVCRSRFVYGSYAAADKAGRERQAKEDVRHAEHHASGPLDSL